MEKIYATKDNQTKEFSAAAWELLPEHKNGWLIAVEPQMQVVANEVDKKDISFQKPTAKIQVVENKTESAKSTEANPQVVANEVDKIEDEFTTTADVLKLNDIKDYLDIHQVKYKNNLSKKEIIEILKSHLENNVEALKSNFKL